MVIIPSIFDLEEDEDSIFRMPFVTQDYGEFNSTVRKCSICGEEFEQGNMKELHCDDEDAYKDNNKMYDSSLFYCRECWFSDEISDASNWYA